jgi:hypothetical protein
MTVDIHMCTNYTNKMKTRTLFRPVGPNELRLIEAAGFRAFPPRLPEQPIFYPVTNREYAQHIAREWNVKDSGSGFVTKFEVNEDYISQFPVEQVGARLHTEYWIPAEELTTFNDNIVGLIEIVDVFRTE